MPPRDDVQTQQRLNALRNQASVDLQLQRHQQDEAQEESDNEEAAQQAMLAEQQADQAQPEVDDGALQTRATQLEAEGKKAKKNIGRGFALLGLGTGMVMLWFTLIGPMFGFGFWVAGGYLVSVGTIKLKNARREAEEIQAQSPNVKFDTRTVSKKIKDTPKKYLIFGSCSCLGVLIGGTGFLLLIFAIPLIVGGWAVGAVAGVSTTVTSVVKDITNFVGSQNKPAQ